jgi:hypothetical protein
LIAVETVLTDDESGRLKGVQCVFDDWSRAPQLAHEHLDAPLPAGVAPQK